MPSLAKKPLTPVLDQQRKSVVRVTTGAGDVFYADLLAVPERVVSRLGGLFG
jgi:hypothetical protein